MCVVIAAFLAMSKPVFLADSPSSDLKVEQVAQNNNAASDLEGDPQFKEQIRVLPVMRTPESNSVVLSISLPKTGDLRSKNPVWVQFRVNGYPLGTGSAFTRAEEIAVSKMGQTVHMVIDNNPYIAINEPAIDPFNEEGFYHDTSYKMELPYDLKEGMHTIRMFLARSFGESLKGDNTFQASYFYVGERKDNPDMNLKKPYITYNEPSDQIPLSADKPILLDFFVKNCELTPDGYKVLLTVDGKIQRTLTSWQPYYIYGLKKGQHTIRLQLIDSNKAQVPGLFNDVERKIQVR